jgi:hypothetical protein
MVTLPPDFFDLIPQQTIDELNQDFGQGFTQLPAGVYQAIVGGLTLDDNHGTPAHNTRQVLTGLEDELAQIAPEILP